MCSGCGEPVIAPEIAGKLRDSLNREPPHGTNCYITSWANDPCVGAGRAVFDMPLLRYFVFVGGALLALLLICDAVLPQVPLPGNLTSGSDLPAVRIRSDRKWPERVVFDTNVPSVAPSTVVAAVVPPAPATDASVKARVREAFAQLPPGQSEAQAPVAKNPGVKTAATAAVEPGKVEVKPQPKRKVARARPAGRAVMLVAQQPHYGLFDTTW
jgi:hypothetical protein